MKNRLKNWFTTILGVLFILLALVLFPLSGVFGFNYGFMEFAGVAIFGGMLTFAKDTSWMQRIVDKFTGS